MFKKDFFIGLSTGIALPLIYKLIKHIKKGKQKKNQYKGKVFVGIQLGGTNFNVAIAQPVTNISGQIVSFNIIRKKNGITYDDPEESIRNIINFIQQSTVKSSINNQIQIQFIGIASFGPLCLDRTSQLYGSITSTPKLLWKGQRVLNKIQNAFGGTKIQIQTDVNAAAYAQYTLGNHNIKQSLVYVTVGTGVGVGVVVHGKTVHGLTHPQGGHIIVERHKQEYEHYQGVCPYHKQHPCLQSMVSNLSIAKRLNIEFTKLADVSDNQKVWKLVGFYLAQLCLNVTLLISPEVIVIGGGIMNRKILFPIIRSEFIRMLAKYVDHPLFQKQNIADYIKAPNLGDNVGVIGAMMLSTLSQ